MRKRHVRDDPKKKKRRGVWEEVKQFTDPDSNVTLVLSERIRGKPAYSVQFLHVDEIGPNKHIPAKPDGAKYELKDIVRSLVEHAEEFIAERRKSQS